jgi:MipA family protein
MKRCLVVLIGAVLCTSGASAQVAATDAPEPAKPTRTFDYVLGLGASNKPSYSGGSQREWDTKPSLGLRWGRFRISSGGASRLLGFGTDAGAGSGASADLLRTDRMQLRLSMRSESGRKAGSDQALAGQPDVRSTLRARLSASYAVSDNWAAQVAWGQDILGRGGGALVDSNLSWSHWLSETTQVSAGMGLTWADSTYLRSYYGTAAGSSSAYPSFRPSASLYSARVSLGTTTALSKRWLVYSSLGYGQLLGDAAKSPLTRKDGAATFTIGLAYRCCSMGL